MKHYFLYLFILLVYSCDGDKPKGSMNVEIVPLRYLSKSAIGISINNGTVFLEGEKFSGYLVQLSPAGNDTIALEGYVNGLLSGGSKKWFSNRQLMEERYYRQGRKNGKQVAFWPNGNKRFEFFAKDDGYEGELREWNVNGQLFHLGNFLNGQENGSQKMWYENGKIRANYVIIDGKRYGLLGTKNCKNVSDSIFVVR